ncbi:MAG: acetoin utilization protein AcuC [Myxococcales bacterium]|nr:acetoin utilization protein AcuC [Myxococcales bacterium]
MDRPPVLVYRGPELGAYGFAEKPWFLPKVRLEAFLAACEARGLDRRVRWRDAPPAADAALHLVHPPAHVAELRRRCATDEGALDHGATPARASVERAATHVVGAVIDAIDRLLAGEHRRAFVPIAGFHHAHPTLARSYCLYNDPAIALAHLRARGIGPRLYVDTDVHFGDGVYAAFADDPELWLVDLHEAGATLWPHSPAVPGIGRFPGDHEDIGVGPGRGTKRCLPLPAGADDRRFAAAWAEAEALLAGATPAFVVLTAGIDALAGDPMAHLQLGPEALRAVVRRLCALADRHAEGRLLVLGGGGYLAENIDRGWGGILEELVEA